MRRPCDAAVKLVARNNEVLATAKTDAQGYAKFDAALAKGEGGAQPAVLVAEKGAGEYAFLDLTLTPSTCRTEASKVAMCQARSTAMSRPSGRLSRRRRGRGHRSGARQQRPRGDAADDADRPPAGWRRARARPLNDQGLGGRSHVLALAKTAMTGTWRLWLHADPKAPAIAERAFLVEDFVPERLDMTLASDAKAMTPEQPTDVKADGKYHYGPLAANLGLEGEVIVRLANKDLPGYAGYQFGQSDEFVNPVRAALEGGLITDKDGKAVISVTLPQVQKTARPLEADVLVKLRDRAGARLNASSCCPST